MITKLAKHIQISALTVLMAAPALGATLGVSETRCFTACTGGSDAINALSDTSPQFGPVSVTPLNDGSIFFDRTLYDLRFLDADTLAIDLNAVTNPSFGAVLTGFTHTILSITASIPDDTLINAEFFADFTSNSLAFYIDRSAVGASTARNRITIDIEFGQVAAIPLPAALPLLLVGLAGLGCIRKPRKRLV